MNKRRKQGLVFLALSVPMMWWGLSNIISETPSSNILAIMISISATFGGLFAISGLVMLATKNSLGIWNPDDKEKDREESLLAYQTKVEDLPVQKEIINQPTKKVNEMETSVEMMKREKELETRRKELEGLLEEVRQEENKLEQALQTKGWVKKDGEWKIP